MMDGDRLALFPVGDAYIQRQHREDDQSDLIVSLADQKGRSERMGGCHE